MALTKETVIDKIEITETLGIQIRRALYIVENGQRIAGPRYQRVSYGKTDDLGAEPQKIRDLCAYVWANL